MKQLFSPFSASKLFPYLWIGQLVSVLGSSITTIILPVAVYSITGSTTTMGLIMAIYMLPNVLVLPVSGWLVDRNDRIGLMMLSDVVRFFIMVTIAALFAADRLTIGWLYGLVGVYGLMDGMFQPAYAAIRSVVFTPEIRNSANALSQLSNQAVRLIGPSLGGLLITSFSGSIGFGMDAFTYLFSFACLVLLRNRISAGAGLSSVRSESVSRTGHWKTDLIEGFSVLKQHAWLWVTILAFSLINICYSGIITVLIPWLFKIHYGFSPSVYGIAVTCSAAGAILSAALFGSRAHWRRRGLLAYGGAFASGFALLLMPFVPSALGLALLFALEGFGIMMFGLVWETSLQELVPQEAFGRVASLDMLGSFAFLPAGYILVGWLADLIGGVPTIAIFASSGLLIVASALLIPAIRRFD